MVRLAKEILAEKENVETTLKNLKVAMARDKKSVIELSAIGTFLQNIYNGIENILKQTLKIKNIRVNKSGTWHKELLNSAVSLGIISEELCDELYEYLTFRHFFVHGYSFELKTAQLKKLTHNIPFIWSKFISQIEQFLEGGDNV